MEVLADAIENSCRLQRGMKLHIGSEGMHTPTGKQLILVHSNDETMHSIYSEEIPPVEF